MFKSLKRFGSTHAAPVRPSLSYPHSLINVPQTQVTTLGNGLRVATEHSDAETTTVGLWIGAGSRFETEKNNGVAHFLEHMFFKGTQNRSREQIEREVENMGAQLNAYTSREQTVFFARCLKKDVSKAVDILSDILQNSVLNEAAIEEERGTILREKEEVEKMTEEVVFDHLHATAYQGSTLGYTILGPDANIKGLQKKDLMNYVQTHYTANRMVLVGAGGVEHDQLCKLGEQYFNKIRPGASKPVLPPKQFTGSEIRIRDDTMKETHLALAVEGVGWTHPDHIPLLVAQTILGSWDRSLGNGEHLSSRLAQQISKEHLANSFSSFNTTYADTGLFGLYLIATDRMRLRELANVTMSNWISICDNVTDADVFRAKNQLKTSLLFSLDSSVQVAEEIGRHLLTYGRRLSPFELDQMIESVDTETVKRVATQYLYDSDPAVVAYGAIEAWPDYVVLRSKTKQLLR